MKEDIVSEKSNNLKDINSQNIVTKQVDLNEKPAYSKPSFASKPVFGRQHTGNSNVQSNTASGKFLKS